jgi:ribonuclease HII
MESALFAAGARVVVGMDEVGRGAIAGPVSVGVVAIAPDAGAVPVGLADSKLLTAAARAALVPALRGWAMTCAVGHASAREIDAVGIIAALRLAGRRALASIAGTCGGVDVVVLDGSHDWLSVPNLRDALDAGWDGTPLPAVRTQVKADLTCASVAAASVLAKVERDSLLDDLTRDHPGYGWEHNRGYGTAAHLAALRASGASPQHRTSWKIPGADPAPA